MNYIFDFYEKGNLKLEISISDFFNENDDLITPKGSSLIKKR